MCNVLCVWVRQHETEKALRKNETIQIEWMNKKIKKKTLCFQIVQNKHILPSALKSLT